MSELTPHPRVLPTPELQAAAALTPSAPEPSAPKVDRGSIWAYLKRAATEAPSHIGRALPASSLEAGTPAGESTSNSLPEVGTELMGGSTGRLLLKVYVALKGLEEHLRHRATESHSRFIRWAAEKSAALVGFVATLFAPPEVKAELHRSAAPEAPHRKRSRLKGSAMPSGVEADSGQAEESKTLAPGDSASTEEAARTEKQSEATVFLHAGLLLAEQRREKGEKDKLSAEREQRDREAHLAVQQEQLLALALMDGVAGPEVYAILASLRQPYASAEAARDGIEASNREDQRNLLRRLEEFLGSIRVAMQHPETSGT